MTETDKTSKTLMREYVRKYRRGCKLRWETVVSVITEMKDVLIVDVTEEIWGEEHEEIQRQREEMKMQTK